VLCIAHALETFKTLNGDDVIAVIERTQGPVVDGTMYAVPGFVAQLEVYHQAAMTALNGHELNGRPLTVNEARPREARRHT